ncbi:hypothetical protein ACFRMN_35110 [Streptomyces sp. NPDC056835]|uniref:hypothetical protein n=1 Tax=Streptomyces sp. NPDC056835 TaxID=3345956 RepID=UPI00369B4F46
MLRAIDAKRLIVDLHRIVHREIGWLENGEEEHGEIPVCGLRVPKHSNYQRREHVPVGPCLTLRLLALPASTTRAAAKTGGRSRPVRRRPRPWESVGAFVLPVRLRDVIHCGRQVGAIGSDIPFGAKQRHWRHWRRPFR